MTVVVTATLAVACGQEVEPAGPTTGAELETAETDSERPNAFVSVNVSGETAYRAACAHCHDAGVDGAPVTGDPDTWSDRSPLWTAVLADHAENGYLGMPARGGVDGLPDAAISQAIEYMLMQTFPDRPPD